MRNFTFLALLPFFLAWPALAEEFRVKPARLPERSEQVFKVKLAQSFEEHMKTCPQCSKGFPEPLCEDGFRLLQEFLKNKPAQAAVTAGNPLAAAPEQVKPPKPCRDEGCTEYAAGYRLSLKTGKPLLLWIGYSCISSERQVDAIHVQLDKLEGMKGTGVAVCLPRNGWIEKVAIIAPEDLCATTLRNTISGRVVLNSTGASTIKG